MTNVRKLRSGDHRIAGGIIGSSGEGPGGSMMGAGLKCVDEDRMPAYLESSKESNVSF